MITESLVRTTLRLSFVFNLVAAWLLVFPASALGQLAGFTVSNSPMHTAISALTIAMLGLAYGWLAQQPAINRPLLTLGAAIKGAAFFIFLVQWLFDAVSLRLVLFASADIVLATLWLGWLVRTRT